MAKRPPREASLVQYRRYIRRYEDAGRPDPEAWLDSLTPHGARVGRAALRWAYLDFELRWREVQQKSPRALTHAQLAEIRLAASGKMLTSVNWLT